MLNDFMSKKVNLHMGYVIHYLGEDHKLNSSFKALKEKKCTHSFKDLLKLLCSVFTSV